MDFQKNTQLLKEKTRNHHALVIWPWFCFEGAEAEKLCLQFFPGAQVLLCWTPQRGSHSAYGQNEHSLPLQLDKAIRISDERVSKEYPASLFPAKQKGITHSMLFPHGIWLGGGKRRVKITTYSHLAL